MKNTVIIIGPQGSGKSTLATLLAKALMSHTNSRGEYTELQVFEEGSENPLKTHQMGVYGEVAATDVYTIIGNNFVDNGEDLDPLFQTMDAKAWSEAWARTIQERPGIPYDEGTMISWFANAIMRGYDAAANKAIDADIAELDGDQYHRDAMRTAAGPEVFHYANNRERMMDVCNTDFADETNVDHVEECKGLIDNEFVTDAVDYLNASARMDRWKSRLFYNKDKELPDFGHFMEGEMSLEHVANPQFIHAILGIGTEGAELMENLLQLMQTQIPDFDYTPVLNNMVRETGDVDWYQELLSEALAIPVSQSRIENIDRLRKRFPDKFTETDATERKDEAVRPVPQEPLMSGLVGEPKISDADALFVRACEDNAGECKREGETLAQYVNRLRFDYGGNTA